MPASPCSRARRLLAVLAALVSTGLPLRAGEAPAAAIESAERPAVTLDVRNFGAIGDGRVHLVSEWLREGRFHSLAELQKTYPFVDNLNWSIDEAAFAAALRELPPDGGTIHLPVGRYVAARQPWKIRRDNVRLTGDGADRSILATTAAVAEGLSVAPYRHEGWVEGADREYLFTPEAGGRGAAEVQLSFPAWAREFQRGELVFIRNGANRFDQDYGEFNEVIGTDPDGRLRFKFPLGRDYTAARFNWAGEVAADFKMPGRRRSVRVAFRTGEGFFLPSERMTISIGENLFAVEKAYPPRPGQPAAFRLGFAGRGTTPPGAIIQAGTKVGKSRAILKLTRTTRNFRCENLQIVGRRKALNLSNSYNSAFADCIFVRDLRAGGFQGGLTIDGDGGRFARFERCKLIAQPAAGMQFARSFGSVVFSGCTFIDANVAFTEFNFDCEVSRCTFEITGGPALSSVIIAGKSCGNLRILHNQIHAVGVATVFDTHADIQSQQHGSEGEILVRGNTIETHGPVKLFSVPRSSRLVVEDNHVVGQ